MLIRAFDLLLRGLWKLKRVNSLIYFFVVGVFFLFLGALATVKSEWFGQLVASYVTESALKTRDLDASLQRVSFTLFPLETKITGIKIDLPENGVSLELDEMSIAFSTLSIFRMDFSIDTVRLNTGHIRIKDSTRNETESIESSLVEEIVNGVSVDLLKEKYNFFFEYAQKMFMEIPVNINHFELENIDLKIDNVNLYIKEAFLSYYKNIFDFDFSLESLAFKRDGLEEITVDGLALKAQASKQRLEVMNLSVYKDLSLASMEGVFSIEGRSNLSGLYRGEVIAPLQHVYNNVREYILKNSYMDISFEVNVLGDQFKSYFLGDVYELDTIYGKADRANVTLSYDLSELKLTRLNIFKNEGRVELKSNISLLSNGQVSFWGEKLNFKLYNYHSNDLLSYIEGFDLLKASLSGEAAIKLAKDEIVISVDENFRLDDTILAELDGPKLFDLGTLFLDKSFVTIALDENQVSFDIGVEKNQTYIPVRGVIEDSNIDIYLEESYVFFDDIGSIAGVSLGGEGLVDGRFYGALDDVKIALGLDVVDATVLGLFLGELQTDIYYSISEGTLKFEDAVSVVGQTHLEGEGSLHFFEQDGRDNLDINIFSSSLSPLDASLVFNEILGNVDLTSFDLNTKLFGEIHIAGGFELDQMLMSSSLKSDLVEFYGERLNKLKFELKLSEGIFSVDDFELKGTSGKLTGGLRYNLFSSDFSYYGDVEGLYLRDINRFNRLGLEVDALVAGTLRGESIDGVFESFSSLSLLESRIAGRIVDNSRAEIISIGEEVFISGYLLGDKVSFDSHIVTSQSLKERNSFLNISVRNDDLKKILGVISSHNLDDETLNGNVGFDLRADFNIFKLEDLDLDLNLHAFEFKRGGKNLNLSRRTSNQIKVDSGEIVTWDVGFTGYADNLISSYGRGSFGTYFEIINSFDLKASFFNILSEDIQILTGRLLGENVISGNYNDVEQRSRFLVSDLDVRTPSVPGVLTNGVIDVIISDRELMLQNFRIKYGEGVMRSTGSVFLSFPSPVVDLKWSVDDMSIPLLKRSSIGVRGAGEVTGNSVPYTIRGGVSILHGQILDSLDDLRRQSTQLDEFARYIPGHPQAGPQQEFFMLDLAINIDRPVRMRNAFAELSLLGNLRVRGTLVNPLLDGRIYVTPEQSKIKFKGYDFVLSEGVVRFQDDESSVPPLINFVGGSQIGQYKVNVEVSGRTDDIAISTSSDPPLAQDDILSLLTLGVTRNVSRELDDSERQQISTIGLGALLFDQFQLTEGITSNFGLRFSIAPEISENETSLIQGRYGTSDSSAMRVRSATRLKLRRQISDRVDLSVSSTLGGSLEQKQEMNINYQFNDRLSIEGVYEMKSREENVTNTPDSIGLDLKWRWSF